MTHSPHDPRKPPARARASLGGRPLVVESGVRLGPYEVLLCIARGGMASVWAARQHGARGFSRLVALKTILPELAAPDLDGMFLDEARVTARIHHPNVCEVFELIEYDGVLALSMEWVDGETLNNILGSRPREPAIDPRIAAQVISYVASGLHAAHELRDERGAPLQLVHRDVSPQNILISRTGHVKVTDFGVAKSLGAAREATAIGKIKGKLSYMSPEQAQGKVLDRRSDIFSLGVVLYLATVGQHPFRRPGESRHQQIARLLATRVKPPTDLVRGYPDALETIVMRALSRNPAQRFRTAEEMARRLQDWVLATGPLVTDHQIAQMVLQRAGPAIVERSERIAHLLAAPAGEVTLTDTSSAADPTLVPTTSRSGSVSPDRRRARATLRVVSTTLTAAGIGLAASFVFSTPIEAPQALLPAPAALSAGPGAAATGPLAPRLPLPTVPAAAGSPPLAGATPSPAPSTAPGADAPVSPPAATPATSPTEASPAAASPAATLEDTPPSAVPGSGDVRPPAAAAPRPGRRAAPGSPVARQPASKATRSSKARKASSAKRKPAPRRDDSFAIKRGR